VFDRAGTWVCRYEITLNFERENEMAKDSMTMETVKGILEDLMANRLPETVARQFEPLKNQMAEFLKSGGKAVAPPHFGAEADAGKPGESERSAPAPFKSVGEFATAVAKSEINKSVDKRLTEIATKAPLGAAEGVGADGGFLVQQDVATEIFARIYDTG
jgi:hypothetical protein